MSPDEVQEKIDAITSELLALATKEGWNKARVGRTLGVSRSQAGHIFDGRSGTTLFRLAGLAKALKHRVFVELMTEDAYDASPALMRCTAGLSKGDVSLVLRFAELVSLADEETLETLDAELEVRLRRRRAKSGGGSSGTIPSSSSQRNTSG